MKFKWLFCFYFLLVAIFVLYSYSQIDLNLTLSSNAIYQRLQQQLILLGYYARPLSTGILTAILVAMFGCYFWVLKKVNENKVTEKFVKWLIVISMLLVLAYPAFSHDLFNYMFDARIVTQYGLDPHFFKALDFPLDPWTRFMRWTHRYYPYGPVWLVLTLIPSFLGMGKFMITLFLFKMMFLGFHLLNIWVIGKIGETWGKGQKLAAQVFYALNPLVLIESLASSHNEVIMLTGVLLAVYFLIQNRFFSSASALIVSIGVKFVSLVLLPLFVFKKQIWQDFFRLAYWLWFAALFPVIVQREPYSWYAVPLVALAALSNSITIQIATQAISAALLVRYLPFILYGDYGVTTQNLQSILMWGVLALVFVSGWLWVRK